MCVCDRIESDVDEPAVQRICANKNSYECIVPCTKPSLFYALCIPTTTTTPIDRVCAIMVVHVSVGSKPSPRAQRDTIERGRRRGAGFNVDAKDVGKSKNFRAFAKEETTKKRYAIDETKTLVGTKGKEDYDKAKRALQSWKHFQLGWSEVDANTSVRKGQGVCVLIRPFPFVWVQNPLEITHVSEEKDKFSFAHTTLPGHLLAGEEKFTVEKEENNEVYFKVETFSKPDHVLTKVTYPAVRALQKIFGVQAGLEMKKAVRNM